MNYILHYKVAQVGESYSFLDLTNDNVTPVLSDGLTFNQYGVVFGSASDLTITKSSISNYIEENEDYTLYFRYKRNSGSTEDIIFSSGNSNNTGEFSIKISSDTKFIYTNAGTEVVNVATGISDTNQHHIAVSRSQGTLRVYVDGTKISEQENNTDQLFTSSSSVTVGAIKDACLDDIVIIKGTALYNSDFEPPLDIYTLKDTRRSTVADTSVNIITEREIVVSPNLQSDTERTIYGGGSISFDTKRAVVINQTEGSVFDTKRIVYLSLDLNFNTKKEVLEDSEVDFDINRIINKTITISEDTERHINKDFNIIFDTERKTLNDVEIGFDTERNVTININISNDTKRVPIVVLDTAFDTKRSVLQDQAVNFDTERKTLNDVETGFDTERNVTININISNDTKRIVGVFPGSVWDTRREVRSWKVPIVAFLFLNNEDIETLDPNQSEE